jgi:hypothetical protein
MMTNQNKLPRILPNGIQSEHAYAYGYLCGMISNLESAYFLSDEKDFSKQLLDLFAAVNQLKLEMYPNG